LEDAPRLTKPLDRPTGLVYGEAQGVLMIKPSPHRITVPPPLLAALVAALSFCAVPLPASAQATSVRMDAITPDDGLSSGVVTAVYRDRTGFLWIGTADGLTRYDGHEFVLHEFDPANPSSLPDNHVRSIMQDSRGTFWIGTGGGGLNRLDPATGAFTRVVGPDSLDIAHDWVETILEDRDGRIWVGTLGGGVSRLDPRTGDVTRYRPGGSESLSHPLVNVLYEDGDGRIWAGTDRGLDLWNPDADGFHTFVHDPSDMNSVSNDRVLSIAEDSTGVLWIGTEDGLNRFEARDSTFRRVLNDGQQGGLSHSHVTALAAGPPGSLWVGTYGGGLNELETSSGVVVAIHRAGDLTSGLRDDRVRRMMADARGTVWLGTWGGGVSRVVPLSVDFALLRNDPADPTSIAPGDVSSVAVDPQGRLWAATYFNGVNRQDPGEEGFTHYLHDRGDSTSLSGDDANRLLASRSGDIWVGTWQNGLNRLDPETGLAERFPADPTRPGALSGNRVTALLENRDGVLWVGTSNGLNRLDDPEPPGRFHQIADLADEYVETVVEGANGYLWVGTAGRGLVRLDPATMELQRFRHDSDRPGAIGADHVTSIHEDAEGTLWVGTPGAGVFRLMEDPGSQGGVRFVRYGEAEGLIHGNVTALTSDGLGRLWISTRGGLSVLEPETGRFVNFDEGNGLPAAEFTVGSVASTPEHLFFGTPSGLIRAPQNARLPTPTPVPVVVTAARALESGRSFGASEPGTPPAELRMGEVVAFEFAVLDFEPGGEKQYAYLLEGLDSDWVELGGTREIAFTNLGPASYALRLRARSRHSAWSEAPESIRFDVIPPFWMTLQFRLLATLLVVGSLALAYHLRMRSITERREADRQREEQFTALLENSHDLVVMLGGDRRVLFQGPSIRRILGYEVDERLGESPLELAHPDDRTAMQDWLDEVYSAPERTSTLTIRLRAANGSWLIMETLGSSYDTPEGERRAILNARDVTERAQAEQRTRELEGVLQQRQKLEAIGTLAGGVAHDFNNLLTVIGGHATLLEQDAGDKASTLESAAAIRRAQESGAALTRQLLAFARKQVVAPAVLDLNQLVAETEKLLGRLVGAHVDVEMLLEADPPFVEADAGQLEQVLMNLVVNARDAMPGGGRIEIRTSNRNVGSGEEGAGGLSEGSWVVLHVADGGSGIDSEALPHIFEPFYTTKQRGHGTGLGLSTVYGIVTQVGGTVTVDTEADMGSTFHIFLPGADREPDARSPLPQPATPDARGTETVLVAEDDDGIRRLVARVLRRQGYRVMEARDGAEALKLIQDRPGEPDLLLTDLVMPHMSGAELANRGRELRADLTVLYMSGYADSTIAAHGLDPATEILLKPFSPAVLLARVQSALAPGKEGESADGTAT